MHEREARTHELAEETHRRAAKLHDVHAEHEHAVRDEQRED